MRLKPLIYFSVVAFLAGLMIYREQQGPALTLEGAPAPAFELEDENGETVSLSDHRGKLVFLNFWATWCGPCVDEIPDMMALNAQFRDRPFQMLAISVNTDWTAVRDFYALHGFELPTLLDPGRQASSDYRAFAFPETFLIDGEGIVIRKYVGAVAWTHPRVVAEVEALVRAEEQRPFGLNAQSSN
jgi:peroxiredoxin